MAVRDNQGRKPKDQERCANTATVALFFFFDKITEEVTQTQEVCPLSEKYQKKWMVDKNVNK